MKQSVMGLLALVFVSSAAIADEKVQVAIINGTSKLWGYAGQTMGVPLKPMYDAASGYQRAPLVTEVIVAVGPGSQRRGCRPLGYSESPRNFTGVITDTGVRLRQVTDLTETEWAQHPDRQGWLNYHFSVNGGNGAYVSQVNVVLAPTGFLTDCAFEVYYRLR